MATIHNEIYETRRAQMFPKLTAAQIERLRTHAREIELTARQVLVRPGDMHREFLVVLSGELEIVLPGEAGDELIALAEPGEFLGEVSTLSGTASQVTVQVAESGRALALSNERLRELIQTDVELSEILMRAFILRRMGLLSAAHGQAMVIGSEHSAETLRLREFLDRNSYPYTNVEIESEQDADALLERVGVTKAELPAIVCRTGNVVKNPSNTEAAKCLGMNPEIDVEKVHDVIVVGAGPAGLAAAVYAASEGLETVVLETMAPGGQAGSSSRIENYLGFPTGISGVALAGRAFTQSLKFGAVINIAATVERLQCGRHPYRVELGDGRSLMARGIVIATGARYRALELDNLSHFAGAGIYFAATPLEERLCRGEAIVIVGGGNSAGQAAVYLASGCRHVHIVIRASNLADSMSHYLLRRLEDNANVTVHTNTELVAIEGQDRLERVTLRRTTDGVTETHAIAHVFMMTGADPSTRWLADCVAMDSKGFVLAGTDLGRDELAKRRWPLERSPYLLETSLPAVFAVGDVRSGSVKRIASAVGEGSMSVQFMHRALADLAK